RLIEFIGAVSDELRENLWADMDVQSPPIILAEAGFGVVQVVLRHDRCVRLTIAWHLPVRGVVEEEEVAPRDFGVFASGQWHELEKTIVGSNFRQDLFHRHGSSMNLKCLWRVAV